VVVGKGLFARTFRSYERNKDALIFASGVSNSHEIRPEVFEWERSLLATHLAEADLANRCFVYFGTCSVYDPDREGSFYVQHKLSMEALVRARIGPHLIFRLPQVVGDSANPSTLTNYLYDRVTSGRSFAVWRNAKRAIIDIDDVYAMARYVIAAPDLHGRTVNLCPPVWFSPLEIVRTFERVLGISACYELVDKGVPFDVDASETARLAEVAGVDFSESYLENVIRKYYTHRRPPP
jgi:nucleoside-diphosphate-sugar epimerase